MLTLSQITLAREARTLFENVSLTINNGQKIGITGANGSGKSSLFALIQNQLDALKGDVFITPNLTVAHVEQETPALTKTALDFVMSGDKRVYDIIEKMRVAETSEDFSALAKLHVDFSDYNGYAAEPKAGQLLHGLGFKPEEHHCQVAQFSGGWRMRLNLARALMCPSDVLLLDEPTNHLDLEAIYWLERWLKQYSGTLLVISHDREFLDKTIKGILHIEHKTIKYYRGNYSQFEETRAEQLALHEATYAKQQRQIKHMMRFVDRFRYKASKSRQAQSRLKAIERMEKVALLQASSPIQFEFSSPVNMPRPLITIHNGAWGYGGTPLFTRVNLQINPGDRIGLLGLNGAGKSTFIKGLRGALPILEGEIIKSSKLVTGYFDQHQADALDGSQSAMQHMTAIAPDTEPSELRKYLGTFAFSGDMALKAIKKFSGGERARLALAILIWQKPALLLLDEPSNHLDMDMREALNMALQNFEGAIVLVSHDRYLLRNTVEDFLLIHDSAVEKFDGDLETYQQTIFKKEQDKKEKQPNKKIKPDNKAIKKLEREMEKITTELGSIHEALADPDIYQASRKNECEKLTAREHELQTSLQLAEETWLNLMEDEAN